MATNSALLRQVMAAAAKAHADPYTVAADMLVESNGNSHAVGDHGTSYNLFQEHQGGRLPGGALGARIRAGDAQAEINWAVPHFKGGSGGAFAAGVQRPADPAGYARRVDQMIAQLKSGHLGDNIPSGGSAAPVEASSASPSRTAALRLIFANSPGMLSILDSAPAGTAPPPAGGAASSPTAPKPAGKGVVNFDGKPVAAWIAQALQYARGHGWKGSVTSGYRSYADQQRIYNSGVRPAAKPGTSNHEMTAFPGGAADVSLAQQLSQVLSHSPYAGKLVWAGGKDPVHFSHPHNGSY